MTAKPWETVYTFLAGERLRCGDYVKLRSDGRVYRAVQGGGYDFVALEDVPEGGLVHMRAVPTCAEEERGMTGEEHAALIAKYVSEAQARVTSPAALEYIRPDGRQQFEDRPLPRLVDDTREELLDVINYAAEQLYRLDEIKARMAEIERRFLAAGRPGPSLLSPAPGDGDPRIEHLRGFVAGIMAGEDSE